MTKQEEREFEKLLFKNRVSLAHIDLIGVDNDAVKEINSFISNLTKTREIKLIDEVEREIEAVKKAVKKTGTFKYDSSYDD